MATTTTPLSQASFSASIRSGRCGALPAPKVSRTTPRIGWLQNALIVAPPIPGNRRSVAGMIIGHRKKEAIQQLRYVKLTDIRAHLCFPYITNSNFGCRAIEQTFVGSKFPQAGLANDMIPVDVNIDADLLT